MVSPSDIHCTPSSWFNNWFLNYYLEDEKVFPYNQWSPMWKRAHIDRQSWLYSKSFNSTSQTERDGKLQLFNWAFLKVFHFVFNKPGKWFFINLFIYTIALNTFHLTSFHWSNQQNTFAIMCNFLTIQSFFVYIILYFQIHTDPNAKADLNVLIGGLKYMYQEYVSLTIWLYKNNGSVSCVGIRFFFMRSLYPTMHDIANPHAPCGPHIWWLYSDSK